MHSDGIYNIIIIIIIIMYLTSTVARFTKIFGKHTVTRKAQRALIRVCITSMILVHGRILEQNTLDIAPFFLLLLQRLFVKGKMSDPITA